MKRTKFVRGAATLGASGTIVKVLGAFYRVPIAALIGCYGLGVYQSAYAFYAFVVTLCSAGVTSVFSRVVAQRRANGEDTVAAFFAFLRTYVTIGIAGGMTCAICPLVLSLARGEKLPWGRLFLAPSIVCACVSAVVEGYFQGEGEMFPTALAEIVGQIVKIAGGVALCFTFRRAIERAAAALCFAVFCAALAECVVLWRRLRKKERAVRLFFATFLRAKREKGVQPFFSTLPVTLSAAAMPLTGFAESLLLPRLFGGGRRAIVLYGLFFGGVSSVAHLPSTICRGIAAASIPDVTEAIERRGEKEGKKSAVRACCLTAAVAFLIAAFLAAFASPIAKIVLPSAESEERGLFVDCLRISAVGATAAATAQTLTSISTAYGRQKGTAVCWGAACIVRLCLDASLSRETKFSVKGAAIAEVGCYFVAFFLVLLYNLLARRIKARRNGGDPYKRDSFACAERDLTEKKETTEKESDDYHYRIGRFEGGSDGAREGRRFIGGATRRKNSSADG